MLNITINNTNSEVKYIELNPSSMTHSGDSIVMECEGHNMQNGDMVRFVRTTETADQYGDYPITYLNKDTFSIPTFPDIILNYVNVVYEQIPVGFNSSGDPVTRGAFVFYFDEPHEFLSNLKFKKIKEIIFDDYYKTDYFLPRKVCIGDIVYYSGLVYSATSINDNGKYVFPSIPSSSLNNHSITIRYYNIDTEQDVYVSDGYVMITSQGIEDRSRLVFFAQEGNDRYKDLVYLQANLGGNITVYSTDNRFLVREEDEYNFIKNIDDEQVSFLYSIKDWFKLTFPLNDKFMTDLLKNESINGVLYNEIKEENINPIIDFEKRIFVPVRYTDLNFNTIDDSYFEEIDEIVFNLHFREREDTEKSPWVTNDTLGWNNYDIKTTANDIAYLSPKGDIPITDADLLYYLGYTDGDVYYQRNNLKKSFIRLSFYDTPNRKNQNLLFYSTIFYDSGDAFLKYVKERATEDKDSYYGILGDETYYVNKEGDNRLAASFTVRDNLNMEHSSEGFYTYFFPSVVSGTTVTEAYMKIEFNHAKYGRIVPLTMPSYTNSSGETIPIAPDAYQPPYFPVHYMKADASGDFTKVDWDKLNADTYIRVMLKWDEVKRRYVWFVPSRKHTYERNGQIVLNLFEPRVNGYENKRSDTITGDTASYVEIGTNVTINFNFANNLIKRILMINKLFPIIFKCSYDGVVLFNSPISTRTYSRSINMTTTNNSGEWVFTFENMLAPVNANVRIGFDSNPPVGVCEQVCNTHTSGSCSIVVPISKIVSGENNININVAFNAIS